MFSLVGCNGIWDFDDDDDTVPKISFNFPAKVNLTNAAGGTLLANAANDYSKLKCVVYQQSTVAGTADTAVSGEIDVAANGDVTVSFQGFAGAYYLKIYNPNNANMVLYKYLGQLTANITTSQTVNETSTAVGMIIQDAKTNGSVLTTTDVTDTDAAVVTVATNIGTAIAAGNSVGSVSAAIAPTSIAVGKSTTSLEVGAEETITVTFTPAYTTNQKVTFVSSDATVASVGITDGKITALKAGTTTITVASVADTTKTATVAVTVTAKAVAVTGISITSTVTKVNVGSTITITAAVDPTDATDKAIAFSSSDTSVATVDASTGVVTGKANGTTVITATSNDGGKKATVTITVETPAAPVQTITAASSFETNSSNFRIKIENYGTTDLTALTTKVTINSKEYTIKYDTAASGILLMSFDDQQVGTEILTFTASTFEMSGATIPSTATITLIDTDKGTAINGTLGTK